MKRQALIQQQNLMQLCLASNNLEEEFNLSNINSNNEDNNSFVKKLEESDHHFENNMEEDEDDDIDEDDDDEEGGEEERINEMNTDKSYKLKTLKRLNGDGEEEDEEENMSKNDLSTLSTVQSLIAAAAATSPSLASNNNSNISQSNSCKKSRIAAIPGKPRGATYDGNSCMICSDRASGFHYGVLACEGCKGFFKRICKEPNEMQNKRHCVYGGNCDINLRTRNRCQYCRIQKCIQLGMSKDGIKLGRRSRKFKENLVHIVSSTSSSTNISLSTSSITTTTMSLNTSHTASTSSNQNLSSSYQDQNHHHHHHQQQGITQASLTNVKLISQMPQSNSNKLINDSRQQQHSNSLINTAIHHHQQQNLIINNGNNSQIIAINADNQLQQFLLPTTGL